MKILVTGGTGYIGSHTCVELLEAGHEVVVVDNLSNSHAETLSRVEKITGHKPQLYEADLRDADALSAIFQDHAIDAVMHFAGLKAVSESIQQPLEYYDNNVGGTLNLCRVMHDHGVKRLVFSSSASVYGMAASVPITEDTPYAPTNPYASSKMMIEEILADLHVADEQWQIVILRYFNPIGAHSSGLIGEDPLGIPNNLMPIICKVARGEQKLLKVFGDDYPTADGSCVRDYIHVVDLAKGHVCALAALSPAEVLTVNLGTGKGTSVLELVQAFHDTTGVDVPYEISERRPGDVASCYADVSRAAQRLGWHTEKGLAEMCRDSWHWAAQVTN